MRLPIHAKAIIASLFAMSSSLSFAELKAIDDEILSDVTGRAGLTIDIDMGIEIGEFMYKDAGSIVMQGIRMGGMDRSGDVGTAFDGSVGIVAAANDCQTAAGSYSNNSCGTTGLNNVRIEVDIAGDGSDLQNNGFGGYDFLGNPLYIPDNRFSWAWGEFVNPSQGGALGCGQVGPNGACRFTAGDGDLFIHAKPIDASATNATGFDGSGAGGIGGSAAGVGGTALVIADYGFEMDEFALKASDYNPGDDCDASGCGGTSAAQETTIMSDLRVEGFLGGFDLLIENHGNSFGEYDALGNFTETGIGDAASKIKINSFFKVTEMEYDFDIAGIRYEQIRIGNTRGRTQMFDMFTFEDYTGAVPTIGTTQSFAQSATHLYAVKDNVLHLGTSGDRPNFSDGIKIESRLIADMDIDHLSFGDTGRSIGQLRYTDMDYRTNMVISAHQDNLYRAFAPLRKPKIAFCSLGFFIVYILCIQLP